MSQPYLNPSLEQLAKIKDMDLDGPITMINLLRFKPDGGREQYARYGAAAEPFLRRSGATVRFVGDIAAAVIGPETWDQAILVDYPSRRAFLEMVSDPEYPGNMRTDALVDSRLYCVKQGAH